MSAMSFTAFVFLLTIVVFIGFINEKTVKLPDEIALMLFSFIGGLIVLFIMKFVSIEQFSSATIMHYIENFNFESFLMNGVLCFMLFAGATEIHFKDLTKYFKLTALLSLMTTLLGALFYGGLFYYGLSFINIQLDFLPCLLLGCVVAPTDPIAATSILRKFNLPNDTSIVIQGESLFNDGVGVALVVCVLGNITHTGTEPFLSVMMRELFGAVAVGLGVSFVLFYIFKNTDDRYRKITISLLAVSACYLLCEYFHFSGAIASVVCGIYFSTKIDHDKRHHDLDIPRYDYFWQVLDNLLNSLLYVMLGFAFPALLHFRDYFVLGIIAILANLIARYVSVYISTFFVEQLPDGYQKGKFTGLLTWGGLKGGLCLALALSLRGSIADNIYYIFLGCTYSIVFFSTIIQGLSMSKIYKYLKPNQKES